MAEATKLKLKYLGPAVRISPGADKNGKPQPFVLVGNEIELTEQQVRVLEMAGHQFEGRQLKAGELLHHSSAQYEPSRMPRPGITEGVPPPPETLPPTIGASTFGGQIAPDPKQQEKLVSEYTEIKEVDPEAEKQTRHK